MVELVLFVDKLLGLYTFILIAAVVVQLLVQTRTVPYSPFMRSLHMGLAAVTEPVLAPIRRRMPATGGIDLSPVVVLVLIWFLREVVLSILLKAVA